MNITTINFGNAIIPIGHAVNPEYTSVLVTDPQAVDGESGAVFLYNLGKGYTGQCTAEATSEIFQRFGTQALGIGNWAGRQLDNFMVSQYGGPGGEELSTYLAAIACMVRSFQ